MHIYICGRGLCVGAKIVAVLITIIYRHRTKVRGTGAEILQQTDSLLVFWLVELVLGFFCINYLIVR